MTEMQDQCGSNGLFSVSVTSSAFIHFIHVIFPTYMFFTVAPAQESMERLAQKKQQFDLIFLDADKPSYVQYYKVQYMNIPF